MIRDYEAIFIFPSQDQAFQISKEKVLNFFKEQNVEVVSQNDMGLRELAYEINKTTQGHYYLFNLKADGASIAPLRHDLGLQEDILRFMIVVLDKKALQAREKAKEAAKEFVREPAAEPVKETAPVVS